MKKNKHIEIRVPLSTDGVAVNRLIASCPPLDTNSVYCNLLQCNHFYDTSICAVCEGEMVGFVSGYRLPGRENTLFIWQVAVGARARGQGLACRMICDLLDRPSCRGIDMIETTITPSNEASRALFTKVSRQLDTSVVTLVGFEKDEHFDGQHETEELWRIGPLSGTQTRLLI